MQNSVLDIFKRSGDAHIGQTLVRLARLAEAAHQHDSAAQLIERINLAQGRAGGASSWSVTDLLRTEGKGQSSINEVHSEVNQ